MGIIDFIIMLGQAEQVPAPPPEDDDFIWGSEEFLMGDEDRLMGDE